MESDTRAKTIPVRGVHAVLMFWKLLARLFRRHWLRIALALLALILGIRVVEISRTVLALNQDYQVLKTLSSVKPSELLQPTQLSTEGAFLVRCESDLKQLRDVSFPFLQTASLFSRIPQYGGDIAQAPALLDYAIEVSTMGQLVLDSYRSSTTQISTNDNSAQTLPRSQVVLKLIEALHPKAAELHLQLEKVQVARQRIDETQLSPTLAGWLRRGDSILTLGAPALQSLDVLPAVLGANGPRTYLLIAENNDELRATGGYISGVGIIQVQDGKISQVSYQDSYAVENYKYPHPWPPKPLTDYMGAQMWVLRDANWSPDFPTSAREIEALYALNQREQVDGVIAVNVNAIQRLVTALAPIDLPAYGERIDGTNVLDRMQFYFFLPTGVVQTSDWWKHRKDFMAALFEAVLARLNGQGNLNSVGVGAAFWESLSGKDILVYLNDPTAAGILNELRWDGALHLANQDSVMVVDSNVGFNKSDGKVPRQFDYEINLQPGRNALASLRVEYRNLNPPQSNSSCDREIKYEATYAELQDACYWDYLRLYVPSGSAPLAATSHISATVEGLERNHAVFSGFFVVPRGESREIRFDYQLPFDPIRIDAPSEYHLDWTRQPGVTPASIHVTVRFPASLDILHATPGPIERTETSIEFTLPSDQDTSLSVAFAPKQNVFLILGWGLVAATYFLALILFLRFRARGNTRRSNY